MKNKKFDIKNCFSYICPDDWDNLARTDNNKIRFSISCEKQVFKATNESSLDKLSKDNKCVAYFANELGNSSMMGETVYPISLEEELPN